MMTAKRAKKTEHDPVMTARDLLPLVKLGEKSCPCPAFHHVLFTPQGLGVAGDGFTIRYAFPYAGARSRVIFRDTLLAPVPWVRDMLGAAKTGRVVFDTEGSDDAPKACADVNGRKFKVDALPLGQLVRAPVAPATAERCELAPGDFAHAGPVAAVLPCASPDDSRPHVHAVHLSELATGCDGVVMARRPLARPPAAPVLLPLPMARALLALCAKATPERLVLRRAGDEAWFTGRMPDGARWTLAGKVDRAKAPPYETMTANVMKDIVATFTVDVGELRALVAPYGASYCLALFPDGGMVAWDGAGEGVGCSLNDPTATPATTLRAGALRKVLAKLPAKGPIVVEVTAGDDAAPGAVLVQGDIVMPVKGAGELPAWVAEAVRDAFGLNGPRALSRPRVEAPPPAYEATAYGLPALHLGPPTAEDLAMARAHGGARFTGWPSLDAEETARRAAERAREDVAAPASGRAPMKNTKRARRAISAAA
jgi:hypothetical protein